MDIDDEDGEPVKKRKKIVTRHIKPTVMSAYRGVDVSSIEKVSWKEQPFIMCMKPSNLTMVWTKDKV